ncbi:restriction endonuclease [Streptomyces sp. NPDC056485]|uniref:restriction endonuclease n=1 Tax=Streptomyces sp. NPDC056485 TaxID=3345834 RepID=UPI0036C3E814
MPQSSFPISHPKLIPLGAAVLGSSFGVHSSVIALFGVVILGYGVFAHLWREHVRIGPGGRKALADALTHLSELEIRCLAGSPLSRNEAASVAATADHILTMIDPCSALERRFLGDMYQRVLRSASAVSALAHSRRESLDVQAHAEQVEAAHRSEELRILEAAETRQRQSDAARQEWEESQAARRASAEAYRKSWQNEGEQATQALAREIRRALSHKRSRPRNAPPLQDRADRVGTRYLSTTARGRALEIEVAALLERDGFEQVHIPGGPGDLGADVVAWSPDGRKVVVQCKHYTDGRVSSPDVQRFGGTYRVIHKADVGVVVTTTGFTPAAMDFAAQAGIALIDGAQLRSWRGGSVALPA